MNKRTNQTSTGVPGLDNILQGIMPGDNVVWQMNNIEEYAPFVRPFCLEAKRQNRDLIYFRFADHKPVLQKDIKANVYKLHPEDSFENFISEIFHVIEKFGSGACYVFDCLSELAVDWYSDRMLGNFFMLTCPYLFNYDTIAYFALLRNRHTSFSIDAIHDTAQVVLDIYRNNNYIYIYPLKVYRRYSKTMYMPHKREGNSFIPVTKSIILSEVLASNPQQWLDFTVQRSDVWVRSFNQAQEIIQGTGPNKTTAEKRKKLLHRLIRMAATREERAFKLAEEYLNLRDMVDIGQRMIGTGLIGGKSLGMLLARAILRKKESTLAEKLESHDSFYIGSDIFYTYLIQNKCWWVRRRLNHASSFGTSIEEARNLLLSGSFPSDIQDQFTRMLDYFGQSPIIVRSSSLLEDAYGNSFSGKYESVFCANQGSPEERLRNFMNAVRTVYASTLSSEALSYRAHWGLLDRDEQMALLVQRVSGAFYDDNYFPQVAGVGFSFNPYVWSKEIDPKEGMIRLVFGLGTRAVDRTDDDYTRIVALNAPERRPESKEDDIGRFTQRNVDIIDLQENKHVSRLFKDVARKAKDLPLGIFASRDPITEQRANELGLHNVFSWILTFDELLSNTAFVDDMRKILKTLQNSYDYPVDIEFTANFLNNSEYKINLLQCRPFQVKGNIRNIKTPKAIPDKRIVLKTRGPIIGNNTQTVIDRLIYVVPEVYGKMKESERYAVARLIGRLTHLEKEGQKPAIMIVGPGRWGTTTPSLGVPVSFAEINTVLALCEVAVMHEGLIPEPSLGTHFFNDLVEMDMLYIALYPDKNENLLNAKFFEETENQLGRLLPDADAWSKVVRVFDSAPSGKGRILLHVNVLEQNGVCYLC